MSYPCIGVRGTPEVGCSNDCLYFITCRSEFAGTGDTSKWRQIGPPGDRDQLDRGDRSMKADHRSASPATRRDAYNRRINKLNLNLVVLRNSGKLKGYFTFELIFVTCYR